MGLHFFRNQRFVATNEEMSCNAKWPSENMNYSIKHILSNVKRLSDHEHLFVCLFLIINFTEPLVA